MFSRARAQLASTVLRYNKGGGRKPSSMNERIFMNSIKRQQLASERIRKLEVELEQLQEKLEKAQNKNNQEDERISGLISTLEDLRANYVGKIQEVETIRNEYEQINNDLKIFRDTMISDFPNKKHK